MFVLWLQMNVGGLDFGPGWLVGLYRVFERISVMAHVPLLLKTSGLFPW